MLCVLSLCLLAEEMKCVGGTGACPVQDWPDLWKQTLSGPVQTPDHIRGSWRGAGAPDVPAVGNDNPEPLPGNWFVYCGILLPRLENRDPRVCIQMPQELYESQGQGWRPGSQVGAPRWHLLVSGSLQSPEHF
jgi:hypothetical protein